MSYPENVGAPHFGEHVTIDGYGGDPIRLGSRAQVLDCLVMLPKSLGMTPLCEPFVVEAFGNDLKDPGGWTGFVVIEESHISIHTFPKRQFVSADIYTCKNGMDVDQVREYFAEKFKLADIELNFLKRGTRYPSYNLVD